MQKIVAILSVGSALFIGTQALASTARVRSTTAAPSYYCGILKSYGQVDVKECGPNLVRATNSKR